MDRILKGASVLFLALLVWLSLYLGANRIYQVDECTETYVARILAARQEHTHSPGHITLYQVLLSLVVRGSGQSADAYASARFFMVVVFWLNVMLIALSTRQNLLSLRGMSAILGAATLAPLWDYGFEIRHDNLLLMGLLLMWCGVRLCAASNLIFFFLGVLAMGLQFVAFKAFVYTLPISLMALIFQSPSISVSRWSLVRMWVLGAVGCFLLMRLGFGFMGWWELFMGGSKFLADVSNGGHRFTPLITLSRLLTQTPLLLALILAAFAYLASQARRCRRVGLDWNGLLPEAMLLLLVFGGLIINPAPFPYNLLFLVPFAFLLAFPYGLELLDGAGGRRFLLPLVFCIVTVTHFVPFGLMTFRHVRMPNSRQVKLMNLAESLIDSEKDPIYDGTWMVVSCPVDPRWFLHSFNIQSFLKGEGPRVRDLLAEQPAAVIIQNYRTGWLPEADHEFIREYYVPLAEDFWVLGKILPHGGGRIEIIHPGRYQITAKECSRLLGTNRGDVMNQRVLPLNTNCIGMLDGQPLTGKPVHLDIGTHHVVVDSNCEPAVVWLGPKRNRLEPLSEGDPRNLFVNWY